MKEWRIKEGQGKKEELNEAVMRIKKEKYGESEVKIREMNTRGKEKEARQEKAEWRGKNNKRNKELVIGIWKSGIKGVIRERKEERGAVGEDKQR